MNLPEAIEAERAVIAAVLTDSEHALDAARLLREEHFTLIGHKAVWKAILALQASGGCVDLVTVTTALQGASALEIAGGVHAVSKMATAYPTSAHTAHYSKMILDKWKLRRILGVAEEIQRRAPGEEDFRELLSSVESQLFSLGQESSDENQLQPGVQEFLDQIDVRRSGGEIGLQTSLKSWNKAFGGILPGRYYALGGRPSMGKTALAEQIALDLLVKEKSVLFISKEMRSERLVGRVCAKIAKVSYERFIKGLAGESEFAKLQQASKQLLKAKLTIVTPSRMTGSELRSLMRRAKSRGSADLVIIDYVQLLNGEKGEDRFASVSTNSNEIRTAANETGIPVLALVQLNRDSEKDSRPSMRHIKDASQIEQDADAIVMLWSDEDRKSDYFDPSKRVITIEKNRDGASFYDERLSFDGPTMTFYDAKL